MSDPASPKSTTLMNRLRHYFFTGLALLFPAAVTVYVLIWLFQVVDGFLGRYINRYWLNAHGYELPGVGLIMTVLLILLAGVLSSHFLGRWVFHKFEGWLARLPLVRRIYPSVKQLAEFLFTKDKQQAPFRRVVLVQYPRMGCYSIAFVTNESNVGQGPTGGPLLTLLIPTPPSPLTGPIILVPRDEVMPLDMTVEEAFKMVVSGGVLAPPIGPDGRRVASTKGDEDDPQDD